MRIALLGAGMAAEYHKTAIESARDMGAQLAAIAFHDTARFREISDRFGVPCLREEDVLADPTIDALFVCTPSGQHAEQTRRAAAAGKHVLVEKPMALGIEDADRMIAACESAGVVLGVVLQRRSEPLNRWVEEAVRAGAVGSLTLGLLSMPYFRSQAYYDQAAWRGTWALDGGGVLMNQGIHLVDLLVWWMGDPLSARSLGGTLQRRIEVEDTVGAVLRFEQGAVGVVSATTTARPGYPHRMELYGTDGCIQIEGETVVHWTFGGRPHAFPDPPVSGVAPHAGTAADPRGMAATGHIRIVRDFINAVRGGHAPLVDGREGRRSLSAVRRIYEAAGLGPSRIP